MAPLPIRDCPRRGFGRVPPVTNRDVEFPGAESMFSRLCGGISGRRGGVPPHRGRPRRRFGRVPPVTNRGLGFPGTESIFSRPCSGIPGRRDGAPSPQGRPRRGFGLVPPLTKWGVEFPGAESIFSRPCGGISGRRDVALPTRAARAGSWRRFPLAAMGAGFPGAESTFSMACRGISGRRQVPEGVGHALARRHRTDPGGGRRRTLASERAKGAQGSGGTRGVRRFSGSPRLARDAGGFDCLGTSERRHVGSQDGQAHARG